MPDVNDLVGIAESLKKHPVLIDYDRCTVIRHRQAKCHRCADACAAKAITVSPREISLDFEKCTACGACSVACPTEALQSTRPTEPDLLNAAASQAAESGRFIVACARVCAKHDVDFDRVAKVDCLTRVDETCILHAAAKGATEIVLVHGGCHTCKYRDNIAAMDRVAFCVDDLLESCNTSARVVRTDVIPAEALVAEVADASGDDQAQSGPKASRRSFFSDAMSAAKDMTKTAARTAIDQELGVKKKPAAIEYQHNAADEGKFPTFCMPRHEALINALFELGFKDEENAVLDTDLVAAVNIDTSVCNGCGMCAVFCPTAAIRRDEYKKPYTNPRFIEFSASDCVQCGLCVDVCWKRALTISPTVAVTQVFNFEPRVFRLSLK